MALIDLSAYKPVSGTDSDAALIDNAFDTLQTAINGGIDDNNFASGKIFDPTKLKQGGAATNAILRWDGSEWAPFTVPACRATHDADQALSNNTTTTLAFNTDLFDTDSVHDISSNNSRLTAPVAGVYLIVGHVIFAANSTGVRQINFLRNGTSAIGTQASNANASFGHSVSLATLWQLSVNDYVELQAIQTSGGSLSVLTESAYSPQFGMTWIG